MSGFAADEKAAQWSLVAYPAARRVVPGAEELAERQVEKVRTVAFSGMEDRVACGAEGAQKCLNVGDDGTGEGDVIALAGEVAAFFADFSVGQITATVGIRGRRTND